jgi:hypothetical protein
LNSGGRQILMCVLVNDSKFIVMVSKEEYFEKFLNLKSNFVRYADGCLVALLL